MKFRTLVQNHLHLTSKIEKNLISISICIVYYIAKYVKINYNLHKFLRNILK